MTQPSLPPIPDGYNTINPFIITKDALKTIEFLKLKRAEELGAQIVTKPTDFYGDAFSRFVAPWNKVWWVYQHNPQSVVSWEEDADTGTSETWEPTEELQYIRDTIVEAMQNLGKGSA